MTARGGLADRLLAPRVLVPIVLAALVLTALLSPPGTEGGPQLSSYSAEPNGARGLHDVARRLGWQATRRITPFDSALDVDATYLVLAPEVELTATEAGRLLAAVRAGAGLMFVPERGTALADSLRVRQSESEIFIPIDSARRAAARPEGCEREIGEQQHGSDYVTHTLQTGPRAPRPAAVFLQARRTGRPIAFGVEVGRGRVVAVSDPFLLRNDVVRLCWSEGGVNAVRMLEWLDGGRAASPRARRLVFAEFHHGFGRQPSVMRSIRRALTEVPAGRALMQAIVAALVLLAATGARAVVPVEPRRVERRSPIEHVGALARAYEQARASRVAARRLVRGLRRRHAMGRSTDDAAFLARVAARHPHTAADVALIGRALEHPVPAADFLRVGEAVARVERALA